MFLKTRLISAAMQHGQPGILGELRILEAQLAAVKDGAAIVGNRFYVETASA
jgi:hypothetical protein